MLVAARTARPAAPQRCCAQHMAKRKIESLTGLFDYGGSDEEDEGAESDDEQLDRAGTGVVLLHGYGDEGEGSDMEDANGENGGDSEGGAVAAAGAALGLPGSTPERGITDGGATPRRAAADAAEDEEAAAGEGPNGQQERQEESYEQRVQRLLLQLPPEIAEPPPTECDPAKQSRVAKLIETQQRTGKTIIAEVRKNRDYRNPDFLAKLVEHFDVDESGTAFGKDIFDPHGLPKADYYEALAKEFSEWDKQRQEERARTKTIPFAKGGVVPGSSLGGGIRPNSLLPGRPAAAAAAAAANAGRALAQAKAQQLAAALATKAGTATVTGPTTAGAAGSGKSRWDTTKR